MKAATTPKTRFFSESPSESPMSLASRELRVRRFKKIPGVPTNPAAVITPRTAGIDFHDASPALLLGRLPYPDRSCMQPATVHFFILDDDRDPGRDDVSNLGHLAHRLSVSGLVRTTAGDDLGLRIDGERPLLARPVDNREKVVSDSRNNTLDT